MSDDNDSFRTDLSWKTRWVIRRNRILGSARFQRWASRTPLVRGIARRRAAAQFDLIAGFIYSQILTVFVETGLIAYLRGAPRSFADICEYTGFAQDAADRLLRAGASLDICESPQAGLWTLGEAGAPLSANTGAMAMIRHHHLLYRDLTEPVHLLANARRGETALSAYWTYASKSERNRSLHDGDTIDYSGLMAATQSMVSEQIIDAYDFSVHRGMLDIGGGSGAFAAAIAGVAPRLEFGIFDLPEVIAKAQRRLLSQDISPRLGFHPGSFKENDLPQGYDLITLVRILHDHDDDVAQKLLADIFAALPPGGSLLIVEPMSNTPHAEHMGDAYFGLYLWAMGSGRPRSPSEIYAMLESAGFSKIKRIKTALPIITSAIVAIK